jgi:WD40 repeat protein
MRVNVGALGVLSGLWLSLAAGQAPPPPPALPPINPANAKADFAIEKLGSPGYGIARGEAADAVIAGLEDGTVRWFEKAALASGMATDRPGVTLKGHTAAVLAVGWHGGPAFISAGADKKIVIWSAADKKPTHTLDAGSIVRALALAPDGKRAASSNDDNSIQIIDVAGGKLGNKLAGHTDWVLALAFNADGKQLASGGIDGTIRTWDVDGNKKVLDIPVTPMPKPPPPPAPQPPPITITALAYSADGKTLAAGAGDGQIYLFNPADGKPIKALPGHTSGVTDLVFHPNNTLLISTSKDRSVRLWNLATGQPFKVLEGHTAWVQGVTLMNQGTRLATVSADQTVRVWELKDPPKK